MNGLQRIRAAIRFESTDHIPVIPQLFGHAATLADVPLAEYGCSGELIARCQTGALQYYGHDAVFAFMDFCVETEALGSVLKYYPCQYPDVVSYALSPQTAIEALAVPDPHVAGRMPELLRAATLLRRAVGEEVLVAGCVAGPMTLATQLLGIETALYLAADNPEQFGRILDFATAVAIRFGHAQIEAGAHLPIVFDPSASPAVVPPAYFSAYLAPRLKQICDAFRQAGALANWLNIAGPTASILPLYPQIGADIANFDYYITPQAARELLPRTCLDGNMKSLLFVDGTPGQVAAEAARLRDAFSGGFILSSGCEIPPESRPENIAAMVAAARRGT